MEVSKIIAQRCADKFPKVLDKFESCLEIHVKYVRIALKQNLMRF